LHLSIVFVTIATVSIIQINIEDFMKNKIKISFLVIGFLAVLSTQSKEEVTSHLSNPVEFCQALGFQLSGKSTQRALCAAAFAAIEVIKEVHKRKISSN
jgi:hypothetical protein